MSELDAAGDVVRRLVARGWDGLVVVDGAGAPVATVSLAQVLRLLLPDYVEDDESLAVYSGDEVFAETLAGRTVRDVLPFPHREPVVVSPDASLAQVAAAMATRACSVVAVVAGTRVLGAVGAHAVLAAASGP